MAIISEKFQLLINEELPKEKLEAYFQILGVHTLYPSVWKAVSVLAYLSPEFNRLKHIFPKVSPVLEISLLSSTILEFSLKQVVEANTTKKHQKNRTITQFN